MRMYLYSVSAGLALILSNACSAPQPPPGAQKESPEVKQAATVKDLMVRTVSPSADFLWASVSTSVGDNGPVEKAPHSDEEWNEVRLRANNLIEAADVLAMPGVRVAKTGETSDDPSSQLTMDQIQALITQDSDDWVKMAHGLQDAVRPALTAIDNKNADALSEAGGNIDMACENCHLKYWYPNEVKKP